MIRCLILVVASGLCSVSASAGTIHVPSDAQTIQIAIEKAAPFDTIIVSPGTYFEAISFGGKVITVQSTNPNDPSVVAATIINAGGLGSVVTFTGGEDQVNTVLDGFTITGGTIGIDARRSRAVIRHCIIRANSLAGIGQADGVIEDCQILNNNGAGLWDCDGPIRRSVIQNNLGPGLYGCDGTIIDSRIERSRSGSGVDGGTADIIRCFVASNAQFGIISHSGDIEQSFIVGNSSNGIHGGGGFVRNSIIAGNRGEGFGSSSKSVLSCTITGNASFGFGGHAGTISHCIIWDNLSGALTSSTTPLFSGTTNPFFIRPGFWDLLNNVWIDGDYHLSPNSPYINAGDPAYGTNPNNPTQDIDGNPRIVGARVDIGAYEFQAACTGPDFDGDGTPDVCDRDIDGDGVPNVADVCDDTPLGVSVDDEGRPRADLNHDCKVDLRDYAIMQRDFFGP